MRKLIGLVVVVAVIVVALAIADTVVRHRVQTIVADRIEQEVPGTEASVSISSFPFLGHLAVGGDVPKLTAHVTGVQAGPIALSTVTVVATGIDVDRGKLLDGTVQLRAIHHIAVTATITQATLDQQVGLPITLGEGTVGLAGIQAAANLTVTGQRVEIQVPPLPAVSLDVPVTSLLPCVGGAQLEPGLLTVTCATDDVPPIFQDISGSL